MAMFSSLENEEPEIDLETLTVKLTGPGPDSDTASPNKQGDKETFIAKTEERKLQEAVNDSEMDDIIATTGAVTVASDSDADVAEKELAEIEDLLRGKKYAKKKHRNELLAKRALTSGKKKVDPLFIIYSSVAGVLILTFAIYFFAKMQKDPSLNLTLKEFAATYQTKQDEILSEQGVSTLDFPEMAIQNDSTIEDDSVQAFYGVEGNQEIVVQGTENKSDSNIRAMQVQILFRSLSGVDEDTLAEYLSTCFSLYAPYILVLYPDMTYTDAITFLGSITDDFTDTSKLKISGDYAFNLTLVTSDDNSYMNLAIISKDDTADYEGTTSTTSSTTAASGVKAG